MNKIIFQISMLGFFIAMVFFGMRSMPLLDVVTNAFIVCISILIAAILIMTMNTYLFREETRKLTPEPDNNNGISNDTKQKNKDTYEPARKAVKKEQNQQANEEPQAA